MKTYVRNGESTPLRGVLMMTRRRWSTLYFVPQPGTTEHWGSAESGRYVIQNGRLTFHHEFTFQGGGDKNLVIDLASTTVETCGIELTPDILKIHFPSGNIIHCRRDSE